MRQVGGFLRVMRFPPTNKTSCHDIAEILLKVALNTKQTLATGRLRRKYIIKKNYLQIAIFFFFLVNKELHNCSALFYFSLEK